MKPHARFSVRVGLGALLASAALPPLLAEAQVEEEGTRRLEAVRVEGQQVDLTASPLAVDFAQFGTQVQLISDEEIETGGFTNFGELAAGL
ncbi:MAG: hypothetical protein KJ961_18210, partial [Alphaproteobacteria bacterium]|nr:hypothetical protein [Alphaproteobacteria bacterium]